MANEGIELEVYRYNAPAVKVDTLTGRKDPTALTQLGDIGGGTFKIPYNDPKVRADPTLLKSRNIIKTRVNGKVVAANIITGRKSVWIGSGERAEEAYEVTCEGLKVWLDDATVKPYKTLKTSSKDTRFFSFASPTGTWYNAGEWVNPTRVLKVGNIVGSPWRYKPTNWPVDAMNAFWLWDRDSRAGAPIGDAYFRLVFPVTSVGSYSFWVAGDNYYSVWLDGEQIFDSSRVDKEPFTEAQKIDFDIDDTGDHIIGIKVTNQKYQAGLAYALYRYTSGTPVVNTGTVTITANSTGGIVTQSAHGFNNNQKVFFKTTGTMLTGLEPDRTYFIVDKTPNTFHVANKANGPAIPTSGTQSGVITMYLPEVDSVPKPVTYSGINTAEALTRKNAADTRAATTLATYNGLPAGNSSGTKTEKAQAKAKASALAIYKTAQQAATKANADYNVAVASAASTISIKVDAYPTIAPGWSPGEVLSTLLSEATARGVRFPGYLTKTWTNNVDTNGVSWGQPLDWSFDIGESYASVVAKMEELVGNVWIDPETFTINMAATRGVDRSVFGYGVDGLTVTSTPVIFEKGKNILSASTEARGKMKNAMQMKTASGWIVSPATDAASISEYGTLEATLDTDSSTAVAKLLSTQIFKQRAQEEEGAAYEIYPTDKFPYIHFDEGDWVLAPSANGLLVKRRILSISTEENGAGDPKYTLEFDTIFETNEKKLAKRIASLGGAGTGSGYANGGGKGSSSVGGGPVISVPPSNPIIQLPVAPLNVVATSAGYWSPDGVNAFSEIQLAWDPVTENTDGSETIPETYEVWGHQTDANDDAYQMYASVTVPSAVIRPFNVNTEWVFMVRALNSPNAKSEFSIEITHTTTGPNTPMFPPSAPTLSSNKGLLIVNWDGKLLNGATPLDPPPEFRFVYAVVATSSGGSYVQAGPAFDRGTRSISIAGLPIGVPYWVKLIAVDGVGISSPASASATTMLTGIDLGDLDEDVTDAVAAAKEAGLAAMSSINLLADPSFELNTEEYWDWDSAVTNVTTSPRTGLRNLSGPSKASPYVFVTYKRNLPCDDSDNFYLRYYAKNGSTGSIAGALALEIVWGATEATMTNTVVIGGADTAVPNTYGIISGTWVAPPTARFWRPQIRVVDITLGHTYQLDDARAYRMTDTGLLVTGSVTTDILSAGSITAEKIAVAAIAAENIQAEAITAEKLAADSVTANAIAAGAIEANSIAAGAVLTTHLAPDVGNNLDISANESVTIIAGQLTGIQDDVDSNGEAMDNLQTYYSFTPDGAYITSPGSPFGVAIKSDKIQMLENGNEVSYWNSGTLYVTSFVGEQVVLGNHQIEQYGTGTVVRAL